MPKYSMIVSTIGRVVQVRDLLESMTQSIYKDFEIIIVDQNEDDRLCPIIEEFEQKFELRHEKVTFKGLTKARNYGFNLSQGEYIMFPDDDCEFLPDTLSVINEYIEKVKPDVLTGRCIDRNGKDSVCKFSKEEGYLNLKNHNGKYVEISEIFSRKILGNFKYDENIGVGNFYGSSEGFDQMIRMLKADVKIYYTPNICFYHPSKILNHETSAEIRRVFYYACGFGYVCKKNNVSDAKKRLRKVLLYIPYCMIFKRKSVPYYKAELAGLLAGMNVEN